MGRTQLHWVALLLLVAKNPASAMIYKAQPRVPVASAAMSYDLNMARQQILTAQFECYLKIINDPPNLSEGPFCNRTWDGWLCWEDSSPGTVVQHCPEYYLDFDPSEKASKVCGADGQWFRHPESNRIWSNYTQCTAHMKSNIQVTYSLYYLAIVGQSLSVVSLLISLWIFFYFKSLSCQRISLHKNTFLSFVLNSVCTILSLSVVTNNRPLMASNPVGCKVLAFLSSYALASNSFWMLCEGIYLHTLIIVAVFAEEQQLRWYFILGWIFPLFPATIYSIARWLFYNDSCWISAQTHLLYIVHCPIYTALLVNMFFLLNIVRVLITKLRVTHCTQSSTYMKAVRATLILVPLLGVQFILLPWAPEGRRARIVCEVLMHIFAHYQGLLVAIIFCFCNAEVQTVMKRQWTQIKVQCLGRLVTGRSRSHSYSTSSFTEMSRVTARGSVVPPNPEPQKVVPPHTTIHSITHCRAPEAQPAAP